MFASAPFIAIGLLLTSALTYAAPASDISLNATIALDTGSSFNPANYDSATNGPPLAWFRGDTSYPISKLAAAATKGSKKLASYQINSGTSKKSTIYGDWVNLNGVSAFAALERNMC